MTRKEHINRRPTSILAMIAISTLLLNGIATAQTEEDDPLILERQEVITGPDTWLNGLDAYNAGDFKLAASEFKSVYNLFSDRVLATRFGGTDAAEVLFRIGNFDPSGTGIGQRNRRLGGVSSIEASFAQSSYALGATYVKLGQYEEAKSYFKKALAYDKSIHDARVRLGLIGLLDDNPKPAEQEIETLETWCESVSCRQDDNVGRSLAILRQALEAHSQRDQTGDTENSAG